MYVRYSIGPAIETPLLEVQVPLRKKSNFPDRTFVRKAGILKESCATCRRVLCEIGFKGCVKAMDEIGVIRAVLNEPLP